MSEIVIIITISTGIVLLLSCIVLAARRWLVPGGVAEVTVNGQHSYTVSRGEKLLAALASNDILLPAACGGRGSCGQCRVTVLSGGGQILATERSLISRREAAAGERLACMVAVRDDLTIRVPDSLLEVRRLHATVRSNTRITTYLTEVVLEMPAGEKLDFEAGDYVVVEAPPGESRFADFSLPDTTRDEWLQGGLLALSVTREATESRAYSLANPPYEEDIATLVVRIATPPASAPPGTPPGKVSSFLFGLAAGDRVAISGPFGEFHARSGDAEMVLIGGGAGIAPLRAILLDQLVGKQTERRISFWYGARNAREICYADEFDELAARFPNFTWHAALSDRAEEPDWTGLRGFIHAVVRDKYLLQHQAPEDIEYYLCGPPLMSTAVVSMLEDLGVDPANILYDDFGS